MARVKVIEKKREMQAPAAIDPRITRARGALEFIASAASEICDGGNEPMPGLVAIGMAETMRWAAKELAEIGKGPEIAAVQEAS